MISMIWQSGSVGNILFATVILTDPHDVYSLILLLFSLDLWPSVGYLHWSFE